VAGNQTSPERLLLTVAEAAQICGYSRSFMYAVIARGEIPAIRLPGSRTTRIPAAWLRQWVSEQVERWREARDGEGGG
jgi:excisionase family DNA binding protein